MASETIRTLVESFVITNWSATPVHFDGSQYPLNTTTLQAVKTPADGWIRCEIDDVSADPASLGVVRVRRSNGVVFITVHSPKNGGSSQARTWADSLVSLFRNADGGGLTYREPAVRRVGERDEWYVMVVAIPYFFDEIV